MTIKGRTVGFLGAGNMGEALIKGSSRPSSCRRTRSSRPTRARSVSRSSTGSTASRSRPTTPELVRRADIVILAVKPQIMDAVATEIAPVVTRRKLLISIAAGVATEKIRPRLRKDSRLIRVMPNTPALVLEGVTAIAKADGLEPDDLDVAREIFGAVGRVVVLGEELLDAVTGLSGSGPAYVAIVIEALADGGVRMGLDRRDGDDPRDPDRARRREASPGDRTAPGRAQGHGQPRRAAPRSPAIAALEEGGLRTTFINGGRAGDPALARARAGAEVVFIVSYLVRAVASLLDVVIVAYWYLYHRARGLSPG